MKENKMLTKRNHWLVAVAVLSLVTLGLGVKASAQTTRPSEDFKPAQPEVGPAPANAPANTNAPAANAPTTTTGPAKDAKPTNSLFGDNPMIMWVVLLGGVFLLYWWSNRSRRKQEQKRREMLSNLKKGDKVTSIGGVIGSVVEVRDDEVTVKVDETNNVRMKFARWAIRGVGEESKAEGPDQKK